MFNSRFIGEKSIAQNLAFRGSNSGVTNLGGNLQMRLGKPTGTWEGDLMIIFIAWDTTEATIETMPNGWTEFSICSTTGLSVKAYYKQATSSEPDYYDFIWVTTGSNPLGRGVISSFYCENGIGNWTKNDESNKFETAATTITTNPVDCINNCLLIIGFANDDDESITNAPSEMTASHTGQFGSLTIAVYYQFLNASSDLTKSITWGGMPRN